MKRLGSASWILALLLVVAPWAAAEGPVSAPGAGSPEVAAKKEVRPLSLPAAVDQALRDNPLVQAALSGRKIADAQLAEAAAGRWPLLQFTETFTRGSNPVFVFGSLLEQGRFSQQNFAINSLNNPDALSNFRTALHLRVPLFDQLDAHTRIAQARIGLDQADHQRELVAQQVRLEVIRSYYGLLVARSREDVAAEAVKMAESDRQRTRDLVETGLVVRSDLLSAEVQLSEFRQQQIQAQGDRITAQAFLNTVLGQGVNTDLEISGQLLERSFPVGDPESLTGQALQQRPDYLRASAVLQAAEKNITGSQGRYLPRIDLFSTYGLSGQDLASGSSDYILGAGLTYNLLDRGRGARLDQARAVYSQAKSERQHLANRVRLETLQAYQQFLTARERVALADQTVTQAQEALRIVQDRYREGLTIITEVLRAQTTFVRARLNLLAARYDYYVGYAQLLAVSGNLKDVDAFVS